MLDGRQAVDLALELARTPTLAEAMRAHPLPPDTLVVIRIAAECVETSEVAARRVGVRQTALRQACIFYVQQILLASDSDCFRVLGVAPGAPRKQMREHLRWLMKWLHPDGNQDQWESVYAERVLRAWREAGSGDMPTVPAVSRPLVQRRPLAKRTRPVQRWVRVPLEAEARRAVRRRRLIAAAALVCVLSLAAFLLPFSRLTAPSASTTSADGQESSQAGNHD
jgi:hypothetical protein